MEGKGVGALAPSKATPRGCVPTEEVPRTAPLLARSFVRLLLAEFATHMFAPSNARAVGPPPTGKAPRTVPSAGRSLVTLPLPAFVAQMLVPSKATAVGATPGETGL